MRQPEKGVIKSPVHPTPGFSEAVIPSVAPTARLRSRGAKSFFARVLRRGRARLKSGCVVEAAVNASISTTGLTRAAAVLSTRTVVGVVDVFVRACTVGREDGIWFVREGSAGIRACAWYEGVALCVGLVDWVDGRGERGFVCAVCPMTYTFSLVTSFYDNGHSEYEILHNVLGRRDSSSST